MVFGVFLASAGESFALPECPGSPAYSMGVYLSWNNCEGTVTQPNGNKYVGEYKDGTYHGQGTYTYADGRIKEGVRESGEFKFSQKVSS